MSNRRLKHRIVCLVVVALADSACLAGEIHTPEQAIEKAQTLFFGELRDDSACVTGSSVKVVVFNDSTTPFLGKYAVNRPVWKVIFDGCAIKAGGRDNSAIWNTRTSVYFDSAEGHLLKIVCDNAPLEPDLDHELTALDAESQLRHAREEYIGFPVEPPGQSFVEAAMSCPRDPREARQVIGQYVLLKWADRPVRPMWIITLRGIAPIELFGGPSDDVPIYMRNRVREIVDGITGRVISSGTIPNVHR